jgi:hypothetical protein
MVITKLPNSQQSYKDFYAENMSGYIDLNKRVIGSPFSAKTLFVLSREAKIPIA